MRSATLKSSHIQRTSQSIVTASVDFCSLPKSFNASYGDLPFADKLPHYNTHNLLARSLHPQCYEHNPGFLRFVQQSGLPFSPMTIFKKDNLEARSLLYRQIAERIWNPDDLLKGVQA